jgi:glucose/arabinose dehydrogenase
MLASLLLLPSLAACDARAEDPSASGSEGAEQVPVQVRVPAGFTVSLFGELPGVRTLKIGPDGWLWAVQSEQGRIVRFPLNPDDSRAGPPETVLQGLREPYGLAYQGSDVFVGETNQVVRYRGSKLTERNVIVPNLPTGGHWTRELAIGPDGLLYVSTGSSCNVCEESDGRRAAVTRYRPDGAGAELVAKGLRNAAGLAFNATTGALWASQNERDNLGDDRPPEEINVMSSLGGAAEDFGWPYCYGAREPNPEFRDAARCRSTIPPALEMQAHSAPLGMVFYDGDNFPAEYRGDLFLAFHGSWNRSVPTGYKVVRIRVADGNPVALEDFATGWLEGRSVQGRPVYPAVGPGGSLLISDDGEGRIWRIRYTGN